MCTIFLYLHTHSRKQQTSLFTIRGQKANMSTNANRWLTFVANPQSSYDVEFLRILLREADHYVDVLNQDVDKVKAIIENVWELPRPVQGPPSDAEGEENPIGYAEKQVAWHIHCEMNGSE
jgi:hypothetical protein